MNDDGKTNPIPPYVPGDALTVARMNLEGEAINAMNRGAELGTQNGAIQFPLDIPAQYCKARLVVTAARTLAGLGTIDGKTPLAGDFVLVATGGAPGTDGLYEASAGAWLQLVRLNYNQSGQAPVFHHGTPITIWDGTTAPRLFIAGVTGLTTF